MTVQADVDLDLVLADIETLVSCESPSDDLDAVARSAEVVASLGERLLGVGPERIVIDGRTHLRWRFGEPAVLSGRSARCSGCRSASKKACSVAPDAST
jgi:glutamate carboxypeptidase